MFRFTTFAEKAIVIIAEVRLEIIIKSAGGSGSGRVGRGLS
jgi:hypothetical protein